MSGRFWLMLALLGVPLLSPACAPASLDDDFDGNGAPDAASDDEGDGDEHGAGGDDAGESGAAEGGNDAPGEEVDPAEMEMDPAFLGCSWYTTECEGDDCATPDGQMAVALFEEAAAEIAENADVWVTSVEISSSSIDIDYIVVRGWFASPQRYKDPFFGDEDPGNINWEKFEDQVHQEFVAPLAPQITHAAAAALYESCEDWITYTEPCHRTTVHWDGTPELTGSEYGDDWCLFTRVTVDLATGALDCDPDECQG